jgi:uncharacterized damage-inducible protein DinB
MSRTLPSPSSSHDVKALFLTYLDFYRDTVTDKVTGLSPEDQHTSRLPTGWSPAELVKHLSFMERRWIVWGFRGEEVPAPWGDHADDAPDGAWEVETDESLDVLLRDLHEVGRRTRDIVEAASLSDLAATTERFRGDEEPPSLAAILFHVLQEYARHTGHLNIAAELAGGHTGE